MTFIRLFAVIMTITFCCNYVIADENTQVESSTTTDNLLNEKESKDKEKETSEPDKKNKSLSEKVSETIIPHVNEDTSCNVFTIIEVPCYYQKIADIVNIIFGLIFIIAIIAIFLNKKWLARIIGKGR